MVVSPFSVPLFFCMQEEELLGVGQPNGACLKDKCIGTFFSYFEITGNDFTRKKLLSFTDSSGSKA